MSDLFGNNIVGFPTRWLKYLRDYGAFEASKVLVLQVTHRTVCYVPSNETFYSIYWVLMCGLSINLKALSNA